MKKVYLIESGAGRANDIKRWFKELKLNQIALLTYKPAQADLFVVVGGDGTLLHAIRNFRKYNKPFFGVNRGTRGFLLNQIDSAEELSEFFKNFTSCKFIKVYMIRGEFAVSSGRRAERFYAFNDIYIKAERGNDRIIGTIKGVKNFPKQEFDGDGIIISTPQGSTAYNYAAGGAIISLGTKQLAVKSICCRQPLQAVISEQKITVEILKGSATAFADNKRVTSRVKKITISPSRESVTLAFKPGFDFEFKRWHV